ncbi:lathosterol oxidase-like isoform X1 [Dicentrarchus labrax]|uniref:lathosterol oxidase-like isoform X1 n=1 Tax=Dicentrarchus labrax TaxID=13489 RepID=UPI0021F658B9|nr:lathosterol oxidase-like isoform X1 [Dicentrarchus labrax]
MGSQLTFEAHINHLCKTSFNHLRNISTLRPILSLSAAEKLVHAFVSSRLNYCNALLIGIPGKSLQRLQYIQNSAARILMRVQKHEHITPILHSLHWLPVSTRIEYKNQVRREIQLGTASIFWMSFPTVALFFWEVRGHSKLYDNISDSSLGWNGVFLSIAGFLFFTDMCIYWIHRCMHHKNIYKHLHKQHHIFKVPTPFASHAFHPLDGFLQSLPYHVYPFIFPLHKGVYLSLFVFVNIWTISIHDGDYRIPGPLICLINGAAHHVDHHLYFNYNYGQYFTLWDRLGGSYRYPSALQRKGPHDHVRKLLAEAAETQ